jgi:hypothetical protein
MKLLRLFIPGANVLTNLAEKTAHGGTEAGIRSVAIIDILRMLLVTFLIFLCLHSKIFHWIRQLPRSQKISK